MHLIKRLLRWSGIAVCVSALYLLTVALMPGFPQPAQPLSPKPYRRDEEDERPSGKREEVRFAAGGIGIAADLYLPADVETPVPCIIMAHGLGGTIDMGLNAYARRFQEAGYAVLAFDYRFNGRSEGEPRDSIWIPTQLGDWQRAIRYARSRPEIDGVRIALWGTSLSGGHVIDMAAEDHSVACVTSQCPGMDGHAGVEMAFKRIGWRNGLALVVHGQRDLVRSWLHLSPHYLPVAGPSGSVALMASEEAWDAFNKIAPPDYANRACARIAIRGDKYRPVKRAQHVRCPVLLQICENDAFVPVSAIEETARRLGNLTKVVRYPIGHFDIYFGEHFEKAVADQLIFYCENL